MGRGGRLWVGGGGGWLGLGGVGRRGGRGGIDAARDFSWISGRPPSEKAGW